MSVPVVAKAHTVHPWPDPSSEAKTAYMPRVRDEQKPSVTRDGPPWPLFALPVALLTGVVAAIGAAGREMWNDEYATFHAVSLSWSDFGHLMRNQDLVHGLYYVLMRLWTSAFGTSLLAMRLPSIIGMAVAAGALTLLGRRLYSTSVGITAGLLFAAIPAVSRYGQEVRSYAWVTALAVLSTLALSAALTKPNWFRWLVYAGLTVTLTYLHFVAALVLLPHLLLARQSIRKHADGKQLRWFVAVGVVGLAAAPLLYLASRQSGQVSWIKADLAAVQRYPEELFGSRIVVWALVLLAVGGAVRLAEVDRESVLPALTWAVVPPVLSYVSYPVAHLFLAKYVLFTLPAWALLAAGALAKPRPDARRWMTGGQALAALAAVGVLVAAGIGAQHDVRRSPTLGEPDFRAAAAVVDAKYQPGDGIVFGAAYRTGRLAFAYELRKAKPADVFVATTAARNGWFYPVACTDPARCLGNTARLWLVVDHKDDPFAHLPANQAAVLRRDFRVGGQDDFPTARVFLLVRKSAG